MSKKRYNEESYKSKLLTLVTIFTSLASAGGSGWLSPASDAVSTLGAFQQSFTRLRSVLCFTSFFLGNSKFSSGQLSTL